MSDPSKLNYDEFKKQIVVTMKYADGDIVIIEDVDGNYLIAVEMLGRDFSEWVPFDRYESLEKAMLGLAELIKINCENDFYGEDEI